MLNLISRNTVKTQLGISTSDYDTNIDLMIPIVSSDVRRILNNSFNKYILAIFKSGETNIDFGVINQIFYQSGDYYPPVFELGQVVYHENLASDTYLSSMDPVTGIYTLSTAAIGDGDYIVPTVRICQWPVLSKMIFYKISKMITTDVNDRIVISESFGPISKSYSNSEINKQWNYPQILIDDLGIPFAKVG
jgi:hypothetical protein